MKRSKEATMEKQSTNYSVLDTQDVSRLLATLILTGSMEAGLRRLYERDSETERDANVRNVLSDLYSKLPHPIATRIMDKQDEIAGRVAVQRWKPGLPSGRKYTFLGGIKKIASAVFVFWLFIFGSAYLVQRHHPPKPMHTNGSIPSGQN
jgi:hypothetical protein